MDATASASLLKQEINKTSEDLHDFAKWKLISISTIASVGLGLSTDHAASPWILLVIPYICAHIDLNCYQYLLRNFVISKFLRTSKADKILSNYEEQCEFYRGRGIFGPGLCAQFCCSFTSSAILTAIPLGRFVLDAPNEQKLGSALVAWLIGLSVVLGVYLSFVKKRDLLNVEPPTDFRSVVAGSEANV